MGWTNETDEHFLRSVARELRESLYVRPNTRYRQSTRRIFLCGASPGAIHGVRDRLGTCLGAESGRYFFERNLVYYPEALFDGLMSGPRRYDLLTLENLLADAVDAVILIVESPGAIAELGAFANHEDLRRKLIVIQDEKYRHARSFIGHGPIRLLQDLGAGIVLFLPLNQIEDHVNEIKASIKNITKANPVPFDLSNVFHAPSLIVPCLFLLERLTREEMNTLFAEVGNLEADKVQIVVSAAISVLLADRVIARERGAFQLTEEGARAFIERGRWFDRAVYSKELMDRIRVDVLTRQRRGFRSWTDDR